jgi:hypothetical protein
MVDSRTMRLLTGAERSLDYMIGQTARLKKEVLTIGKTGNSMNQEPSLNIMMYVLTCSPILYCKFGKPLPVILKEKLWTPLVLTYVGMDMKTRL